MDCAKLAGAWGEWAPAVLQEPPLPSQIGTAPNAAGRHPPKLIQPRAPPPTRPACTAGLRLLQAQAWWVARTNWKRPVRAGAGAVAAACSARAWCAGCRGALARRVVGARGGRELVMGLMQTPCQPMCSSCNVLGDARCCVHHWARLPSQQTATDGSAPNRDARTKQRQHIAAHNQQRRACKHWGHARAHARTRSPPPGEDVDLWRF